MAPRRDLLSPRDYDDDAESLRSPLSEQDSDSEDDEFLAQSRTTLELSQHDRAVLEDEEETEKLLTRSGPTHDIRRIFSPNRSNIRIGKKEEARRQRRKEKRDARKALREKRHGYGDEEMYEMEEGHPGDDSSLLGSSSELDERIQERYADAQVCYDYHMILSLATLTLCRTARPSPGGNLLSYSPLSSSCFSFSFSGRTKLPPVSANLTLRNLYFPTEPLCLRLRLS